MFKKTLLAIGVSIMGSPTFAEGTCIKNTGPGKPTVEFNSEGNGYYTISMYGHIRNTYRAIYHAKPSPFSSTLEKVADGSTHKDMPTQLNLFCMDVTHTDIGYSCTLSGLLPEPVEFNEFRDCT